MARDMRKKDHPGYMGMSPLVLDNGPVSTELTDDQKADFFLAKYMENVHPITLYADYFKSGAKDIEIILRDIKLYYKKLVLKGTITEKEYVTILDSIMRDNRPMSQYSFDYQVRAMNNRKKAQEPERRGRL